MRLKLRTSSKFQKIHKLNLLVSPKWSVQTRKQTGLVDLKSYKQVAKTTKVKDKKIVFLANIFKPVSRYTIGTKKESITYVNN